MGIEEFAWLLSRPPNEIVVLGLAVAWAVVILSFVANPTFKWNRFAPVFLLALISVAYYAAWAWLEELVDELRIESDPASAVGALYGSLMPTFLPYVLFPLAVVVALRRTLPVRVGASESSLFWGRLFHFYVPILNLWKPFADLREIQEGNSNGKWRVPLAVWWVSFRVVGIFALAVLASRGFAELESGIAKIQSGSTGQTVYSRIRGAAVESLDTWRSPADALSRYPDLSAHSDSFERFVGDVAARRIDGDAQAAYRYPEFFPYSENFDNARAYLSFWMLLDAVLAASWILVMSLVSKDSSRFVRPAFLNKAFSSLSFEIRKRMPSRIERYYEGALKELESESADRRIWAKAMVDSGGNPDKTKSLYLKYRARELLEKSLSRWKAP